MNQENGGLSDEDILNFESGDEEFLDRPIFDPIFQDAENNLEGRRFYFDHSYILKEKDSLNSNKIFSISFFSIKIFELVKLVNFFIELLILSLSLIPLSTSLLIILRKLISV